MSTKKGISLVALIITIVVLIILTGAVMMTMNQGDIMGKAKEAVIKSDIANFKEELRNSILQAQLNGTISGRNDVNVNETDWNAIKQYIPSATEEYTGSLSIAKGELMFVPQNAELYNAFYSTEIETANTYGQVDNDVYTLKDDYALTINRIGRVNDLPAEVTSIAIPYGVTAIEDMTFSYCSSLKNIVIPNTVETIGNSAFAQCTGLTDIIIPNSVTTIGTYAFDNCYNLTDITISNSIELIDDCVFQGCGIKDITIPNCVGTINFAAFGYCSHLTSVIVDNSIDNISINNNAFLDSAFEPANIIYLR